jgi:hypothetical protein
VAALISGVPGGGYHAENLFVGQTWKGFWRVWVGDDMAPQVFTNATDAKAFAATLTAVAA